MIYAKKVATTSVAILFALFIVATPAFSGAVSRADFQPTAALSLGAILKEFVDSAPLLKSAISLFSSRKSSVFAQTAGFGGGSGSLVIYFQEDNGVSATNSSCPTGWTTALDGYGPHYIAEFDYDWIDKGNLGGFEQPTDPPKRKPPPPPPPSKEPQDPPPPPPGEGPQTPNSDEPIPEHPGTEPPYPPLPPDDGSGWEPGENPPKPGVQAGGGGPNSTKETISPIAAFLSIKKAHAQASTAQTILNEVAIASDSVCSVDKKTVVPFEQLYNNKETNNFLLDYSKACFIDTATGIETCNRCKICVK